ncbi:hypothetical protein MKZ38_000277 [Zalerion maritima]|uniref:Uncharacterized protein n=1 Tax=Zalerion maritima TaxID=339359 RepID=A0AAD5RFT3_9PEZI|nr:hypothetical protein MKZ38_000277 [Zalerion maritima]
MPAINPIVTRNLASRAVTNHLAKRNWAKDEAGVVVVLCIVFVVFASAIGIQVMKAMKRKKERAAIAATKA